MSSVTEKVTEEIQDFLDKHKVAEKAVTGLMVTDKVIEKSGDVEANESVMSDIEVPAVVQISAIGIFEDSPNRDLGRDAVASLFKLIKHKEHLENNVENIEWKHLSSREFRDNRFKHTVEIVIHVKTANLWEGARAYLWKHIGGETWTRGNGTVISLAKMHQK